MYSRYRCEDTIIFCEVHKQFYNGPAGADNACCGQFFDPTPIFSYQGTCYTTKFQVMETLPYIYNSIKLWVLMSESKLMQPDMVFKASDAAERSGINFAVSGSDVPSTLLSSKTIRASLGESTAVALSVREV